MKRFIRSLTPPILKNSMFMLFSVLTLSVYGQTLPPLGDLAQNYCTQATYQNAGIAVAGDNLGDLKVYGENLAWYQDAALTQPITNPDAEILTLDGEDYYVTQTVGGIESAALKVTVMEQTCGCIKEPDFEDQQGNFDADQYEFYNQNDDFHKVCGMQLDPTAISITPGTLNGTQNPDYVAPVDQGNDQLISAIARTMPSNPNSKKAIRVGNHDSGSSDIIYLTKEFVAGEVLVLNYALVLEDGGHPYEIQPFFQANLYDQNNNLIQSRCLVASDSDCIFIDNSPFFYTTWSCLKFNTRGMQGQKVRLEVITGDCADTVHRGYVYLDDLYVGEDAGSGCSDFNFGFLAIDDIQPVTGGGNNCYIVQPPVAPGTCGVQATASLPFPMQVCGTYAAPVSSGGLLVQNFTVDILQNGVVVGTVTPTMSGGTFCFTIDETDINGDPYGDFEFSSSIDFQLDCGTPYHIEVSDQTDFEACPPAGCPLPLIYCDDGSGTASFDLTQREAVITNGWQDGVTFSYYEDANDAFAQVGAITSPANYTTSTSKTIYVRTDWDLPGAGNDNCFYLVELQVEVLAVPEFINGDENIVVCGPGNINVTLGAAPSNMADMDLITYEWFKEGTRLPVLGSTYVATEAGTYTVTVSNNLDCSVTKTITVEKVDYTLDLGDNNLKICGDSEYTFKPTITDNGSTNPIDDTQIQYNWSTGETTEQITITDSGTYTLETTYKGCVQTKQVTIEIADRPEVSLGGDIIKCASEIVDVQANTSNFDAAALEYTWYRDGGVISGETGSSIQVTEAGTYKVKTHEVGAGACVGEDVVEVTFYENEGCAITQGISPDTTPGKNDALDLAFLNDRTGISSIEIFNRHGRSVYKKTGGYTNEWAGQTDDGDDLVTGTYYYVIQLDGVDEVFKKQVLTGWIYVNREIN